MKMKFKGLYAMAVGAVTVAMANSAFAAPSLTLSLVYVGTTVSNTSSASSPYTGTITANNNLSSPTVETTPNLKALFDVYALYNDPTNTTAMQYIRFDVKVTNASGPTLVGVSSNNLTDTASQKYYKQSILDTTFGGGGNQLFSTNSDGGPLGGDLTWITVLNTDQNQAFSDLPCSSAQDPAITSNTLGQKLGRFGLAFTGTLTSNTTVTISESTSGDFIYWTDPNSSAYTASANVTPASITIPAPVSTPEPASLGVLALGGVALLARRRKTA